MALPFSTPPGGGFSGAQLDTWLVQYDSVLKQLLLGDGTILPALTGRVAVLTGTRNLTTASGTQAFTGAGFQPKVVIIIAGITTTGTAGIGFNDGTNKGSLNNNASSVVTFNSGWSCLLYTGAGAYQGVVSMTMDADGATLTWTKTGSPTGTADISLICLG